MLIILYMATKSKLFYLWLGEAYLWRTKIIRKNNWKFNVLSFKRAAEFISVVLLYRKNIFLTFYIQIFRIISKNKIFINLREVN